MGESLFFTCLKEHTKRISKTPSMPALRVPCDARMSRRDVKLAYAQTATPRNLRLILCFSASLNGRLRSIAKAKDQRLKTREKSMIYRHSGMSLSGTHSLYYFWIPAFAGMTEEKLRCLYHRISPTDQVLIFVLTTSPFVLSSTGSLERKRARTV